MAIFNFVNFFAAIIPFKYKVIYVCCYNPILNRLVYLLLIISLQSCQSLDSQEFINWAQTLGNGLRVTKDIGSYQFDIQCKPSLYLDIERSAGTVGGSNSKNIEENFEIVQFSLRFSASGMDPVGLGANTPQDIMQSRYYYAFDFQKDVFLELNGARIPCGLFHMEDVKDSNGRRVFHFVFEIPKTEAARNAHLVLLVDSERISSLPIKFTFSSLSSLPQVTI